METSIEKGNPRHLPKNKKKNKKQITIRLDEYVINYFKNLSDDLKIPYQALINLYLKNCADSNLKPLTTWSENKDA